MDEWKYFQLENNELKKNGWKSSLNTRKSTPYSDSWIHWPELALFISNTTPCLSYFFGESSCFRPSAVHVNWMFSAKKRTQGKPPKKTFTSNIRGVLFHLVLTSTDHHICFWKLKNFVAISNQARLVCGPIKIDTSWILLSDIHEDF